MSFHAFTGILLALALSGVAQPAATPSADALAAALQHKYDAVRTLAGDFAQTYTGGVLHKTITNRGHVWIEKPGRMRWEYDRPERKLFVSDGFKIYSYIPADHQVIVSSVPQGDQASTPTLFLAGKGDLTRDFQASLTSWPGAPPGTIALKLVPKQRQRGYDWLVLVVDRSSLELRVLVERDPEGGTSSIAFSHLKENVKVPDRLFTFKMPPGVDVVTDTPHR